MRLKVEKKSGNSKSDKYSVTLTGKTDEVISNFLVNVELKIHGKYREIIDDFPLDSTAIIKMNPGDEE